MTATRLLLPLFSFTEDILCSVKCHVRWILSPKDKKSINRHGTCNQSTRSPTLALRPWINKHLSVFVSCHLSRSLHTSELDEVCIEYGYAPTLIAILTWYVHRISPISARVLVLPALNTLYCIKPMKQIQEVRTLRCNIKKLGEVLSYQTGSMFRTR